MRSVLAILFAVVLCGGPARAGTPDFEATAHTVAVLSLLGDYLQRFDGTRVATPGAGFDDLGERAMRSQIAIDLPNATVVRVGGSYDVWLQQMYPRTGFGDPGMKNLRASLKDWAAVHSVDYIVVLRKTVGVIESTTLGVFGGITDRWTLFGIGVSSAPYAFLSIEVLDGKTLQVVSTLSVRDLRWGSISYEGRHEPTPEHLPILIEDTRAMLTSILPGLTHGAGL